MLWRRLLLPVPPINSIRRAERLWGGSTAGAGAASLAPLGTASDFRT